MIKKLIARISEEEDFIPKTGDFVEIPELRDSKIKEAYSGNVTSVRLKAYNPLNETWGLYHSVTVSLQRGINYLDDEQLFISNTGYQITLPANNLRRSEGDVVVFLASDKPHHKTFKEFDDSLNYEKAMGKTPKRKTSTDYCQ